MVALLPLSVDVAADRTDKSQNVSSPANPQTQIIKPSETQSYNYPKASLPLALSRALKVFCGGTERLTRDGTAEKNSIMLGILKLYGFRVRG